MWEEYTRLVQDDVKNQNNRFDVAIRLNECMGPLPGPFWGRHHQWPEWKYPDLLRNKPEYPYKIGPSLSLDEKRWVEERAKGTESTWHLLGGARIVGSQCIVGIPVICRLRDDPVFAPYSRVWPFETEFTSSPTPEKGAFILHGEIWPSVIAHGSTLAIRDQAQVRAVVSWLSRLDEEGQLGVLFDVPRSLPSEALKACVDEEGWIIGVR